MERLTERDEYGNADIIALSDMMPELYAELSFSETNALTDALNRLAAYEDTGLEPGKVKELAEAEKDGRLVVLPFPQHSTLLDTSMAPKIIKDVRVSISYTQDGVIYSQPFGIFLENVKDGYITLVSEEAEAALVAQKGEDHETNPV